MDYQKVMRFMIVTGLLLGIGPFSAYTLHAGGGGGIYGSAGTMAAQNGEAARINRQLADRLYQQSLKDESAAWSSFPPNVSLLSKALQQSKDAKALDDQAKEFARSALHAAQTGVNAGDFTFDKVGAHSEEKLKELATTSSPLTPQVQKTLGAYGMDLDSDKMQLKTPFGTFSTNADDGTLEEKARSIAKYLGYSPDDVSKGIESAKSLREKLGKNAERELTERLKDIMVAGESAPAGEAQSQDKDVAAHIPSGSASSGGGSDKSAGENAYDGADDGLPGDGTPGDRLPASASEGGEESFPVESEFQKANALLDAQLESLEERFRKQGVQGAPSIIAHKDGNIFKLIHIRYQSLRDRRDFIEDSGL